MKGKVPGTAPLACMHLVLVQRSANHPHVWMEGDGDPDWLLNPGGHGAPMAAAVAQERNGDGDDGGASHAALIGRSGHSSMSNATNVSWRLWIAATNGDVDEVKACLAVPGVEVDWVDREYERTALYRAAGHGHVESVLALVLAGANVNAQQVQGASPLSIACQEGHEDCVRVLLSHGSDANLVDESGVAPLYLAAQSGFTGIVWALLRAGARVNWEDSRHGFALYVAAKRGHTPVVRLLLEHGADVHMSSPGWTPLFAAADGGHTETLSLLLEHGAVVNVYEPRGFTPLHFAAYNGSVDTVRALLSNGANPLYRSTTNVTPLEAAHHWHPQNQPLSDVLTEWTSAWKDCRVNGWQPCHHAYWPLEWHRVVITMFMLQKRWRRMRIIVPKGVIVKILRMASLQHNTPVVPLQPSNVDNEQPQPQQRPPDAMDVIRNDSEDHD